MPRALFIWFFIISYLVIIAVLALYGQFIFMTQMLAVPILFIAALFSRRLPTFILHWSVFLAAMIFLDTLRGLIYVSIHCFHLPVYSHYVIALEKYVLFGHIAPHILQQWLAPSWQVTPLDKFFAVLYGSHFIFFLLLGLLIWHYRQREFIYYQVSFILMTAVALLVFLFFPTLPPWMASQQQLIPKVMPLVGKIYNVIAPLLFNTFNTDPIAAMPSLHAGFAALCALIAVHHFRYKGILVVIYALIIDFACIALGAHYLVDILAGTLLAVIIYVLSYHQMPSYIERFRKQRHENFFYFSISTAMLLLAFSILINHLTQFLWHYCVVL